MEQRTWQFVTYLTVLSKRLQQRISYQKERDVCQNWRGVFVWACLLVSQHGLCVTDFAVLKLPTRLIKVETHDSQLIRSTPSDAFPVKRLVPRSAWWSGWKWFGNTRLCLWNNTSNVNKRLWKYAPHKLPSFLSLDYEKCTCLQLVLTKSSAMINEFCKEWLMWLLLSNGSSHWFLIG